MATVRVRAPFIGVDKKRDPSELRLTEAQDAENAILDTGKIRSRPGWETEVTLTDGPILGIHDFLRKDGTATQLIKSSDTLYALSNFTVSVTLTTGLSATEVMSFITFNDRAYGVDGTNFIVTDGTSVFDATISRPASAVTVTTTTTSGNLTGDYDYKYTFYSSSWGQESTASDASSVVTPAGEKLVLSSFGAAPDSRIDKIRIYRRKVSAAETEWFLTDEITHTTGSYTDNVLDVNHSLIEIAPPSQDFANPPVRYAATQAGVAFFSGEDANPDRLYYTRVNQPWHIDNFLVIGSQGESEPINAIFPFQGRLAVGKDRTIWIVAGNSEDTFFSSIASPGVGIRAGHAVALVDGIAYFLSEEGAYLWDGEVPLKISRKLDDDFASRNFSRDKYAAVLHDYKNNVLFWYYTGSGGTSNDTGSAYMYRHSQVVDEPSWVPWDMGTITSAGWLTDSTSREAKMVVGFSDGKVATYGAVNADGGSAFDFRWRTGRLSFGLPMRQKKLGEWVTEVTKTSANVDLELRYLMEEETDVLCAGDPHDMRALSVARRRLRRRAREITLEYYASINGTAAEILGFEMEAEIRGRAHV